ncbi:ectonucleoside triphosphate diphosphohydrolase 3 isoform X2 [Takifugu flavidus]|nr:ectonucleoside triphosphate diphosphohydrolase 3 isoform X2 [Takifugu flavidus]XP_056900627.1 ectonucleoside triphosphate diphosphohydrolase 3 isoform X2 [Takifugu flavidus]XP_056900628.1 ectonucleoside triphosphate diphosphohydrolase 3 isoform X2 [Takifugu flavidus]
MASKRQMGYKCRIAGVMLLLLASIAALVAVAVIQDSWASKEYTLEYGIVIDAGSSRSNLYVYEWPGEKENETGVVTESLNCRVPGDGISDMEIDPGKNNTLWERFQECMDKAMKVIPAEKHKSTPLFLGATAGMRLLHMTDEQRSNNIMKSLKQFLNSLPFDFKNASIISGQEEGLYGWVTVNYLMGNFLEKNLWNAYIRPEGSKTVGSMDLGGASTQIAFDVQDELTGPDYMHVKLYGYPYNVYTHSFLCYGKNEAEKMILDAMVQASSDPSKINNPCYPEGFNTTIMASDIYETPCTKKPQGYNPNQKLFMVGSGNSDICKTMVKSIFDFKSCSSQQCSFNGVEQPPVSGDFLAYAGYFFVARALQINETSEITAEMEEFTSSVRQFCETHWTVLKQEKSRISDRYLKTYCFGAHYVYTLLADGYKFDKDNWKQIHFTKEVKSTSIGWSLGYMLTMSNMMPSEIRKTPPMTDSVFAGLVFLFSALTIVTVVLAFIILVRTCF